MMICPNCDKRYRKEDVEKLLHKLNIVGSILIGEFECVACKENIQVKQITTYTALQCKREGDYRPVTPSYKTAGGTQ